MTQKINVYHYLVFLFSAMVFIPAFADDDAKVVVLGYGGTIAGTAKSPFNRNYIAAQACLAKNKNTPSDPNPTAVYSITDYLSEKLNNQPPQVSGEKNYQPESIFQCQTTTDSICGEVNPDCMAQSCQVAIDTDYLKANRQVDFCDIERIDSAKAGPKDWVNIGTRVQELVERDDVKGVVITHGTDTLEETAYFLNLVVKTNKPVVVVGAMRASNHVSADGYMNLMNAIFLASDPQAADKGVLVLLNDQIYGARDVSKTNTTNVDTFKAKNTGPLGIAYFGVMTFYGEPTRKHTSDTPFTVEQFAQALQDGENRLKTDYETAILYDFSAGDSNIYHAMLGDGGFKGLVIATTGNGGMSDAMECAINGSSHAYLIGLSSRTGSGIVTNVPDELCGTDIPRSLFFSANDLNPQKARVLMVVALSHLKDSSDQERLAKLKEYFANY